MPIRLLNATNFIEKNGTIPLPGVFSCESHMSRIKTGKKITSYKQQLLSWHAGRIIESGHKNKCALAISRRSIAYNQNFRLPFSLGPFLMHLHLPFPLSTVSGSVA